MLFIICWSHSACSAGDERMMRLADYFVVVGYDVKDPSKISKSPPVVIDSKGRAQKK